MRLSTLLCVCCALNRRPSPAKRHSLRFLWIGLLVLLPSFGTDLAHSADAGTRVEEIKQIVQSFAGQLGITQPVTVSVVPTNSRLASAERIPKGEEAFQISFEEAFLRTLDHEDLTAAVAHELGHIWIFTHFPFLQTEPLANRQALKLVSRNNLQAVYEKIWKWKGEKGNLERVLDPVK